MTEPTYFLLVCDDVPHDVVATDSGPKPLAVARVVRGLTGLSLWRSKVLATNVPAVILDGVLEEEATAAVEALRGGGGAGGDAGVAGAGVLAGVRAGEPEVSGHPKFTLRSPLAGLPFGGFAERVGEDLVRQTKIGLATASMVMSLTLSACGTQGAEPRPPHDTTSAAQTEPLSQTDLDRAALTAADVQGYEVQRAVASPAVSRKTAEPASCAPVMHAVGGSSGAAATARIARHVFPKEHGAPSAQLTLSSYDLPTARAVMDDLRTSAKACATYKDVLVDFTYEDVNLGPSPSYGDESLSLTLTQLASTGPSDPPVRVPYAVVAVRKGTTVAMFTTFTHSGGDGASGPAAVPEAIVEAQVGKLGDGG